MDIGEKNELKVVVREHVVAERCGLCVCVLCVCCVLCVYVYVCVCVYVSLSLSLSVLSSQHDIGKLSCYDTAYSIQYHWRAALYYCQRERERVRKREREREREGERERVRQRERVREGDRRREKECYLLSVFGGVCDSG